MSAMPGLRIVLVGPLPPPSGGMANQTRALAGLLAGEGALVTVVQTNAAYRPAWIGRVRGVRAGFRLAAYARRLWRALHDADVAHVMANSGWSWHLVAAPALWLARLRRVPAVVHYHGGEAVGFLARSGAVVRATMARAAAVVVPSRFLQEVFARHGIAAVVIANVVDLARFHPRAPGTRPGPRVLIARNLERIYDVATALRAFAVVRMAVPDATLCIAGTGPERAALLRLRDELALGDAVEFCGRLEPEAMAERLRDARISLNPSLADNMPVSVLEAMASGVTVVSTRVGGVPFVVRDGVTGVLVAPGDAQAMAGAIVRLLSDEALAARLAEAACADAQQYAWPRLRQRWVETYARARGAPARSTCVA